MKALYDAEANVEIARIAVQGALIAGAPEDVQNRLLRANDNALAIYLDAVREAGLSVHAALDRYAAEWTAAAQDITNHYGKPDWGSGQRAAVNHPARDRYLAHLAARAQRACCCRSAPSAPARGPFSSHGAIPASVRPSASR